MQRSLFLVALLICFSFGFKASAQKLDIGLMVGTSYYYGDVVNEFVSSALGQSYGGFLRYRLGDRVAIKGHAGYVKILGDDQYSSSQWQVERNWAFQTTIIESSLQLEYNFIQDRNKGRRFANPFIPYAFAGVGVISFTPQADYMGTMLDLAPLQLSGNAYSTTAVIVPFGFGMRYYVLRNLQIGLELGARYSTTSYLDDIAPNDKYVDPATTPNPSLTAYFYSKSTANKNPGDLRSKMGDVKSESGSNGINTILGKTDLYFVPALTVAFTLGNTGGGGGSSRGRGPSGKAIRCPRFY